MANPQLENGYLKISNEIMEALAKIRIPGEARQMLDVIIRKTYGYEKKTDQISTSQFCELTGLKKGIIHRARKRLLYAKLITVYKNDNSQYLSYSFQKDYDKWIQLPKKHTVRKKAYSCIQKSAQTVPIIEGHNINKDNIQKKETHCAWFESIWSKYPKRIGKKQAFNHFKASVLTEADFASIETALKHYIVSPAVERGFVQNGSTWFNNWRDWVEPPADLRPKGEILQDKIKRLMQT